MAGETDSNGDLKTKAYAIPAGETPGDNQGDDGEGTTDTSGNLMCKFYS